MVVEMVYACIFWLKIFFPLPTVVENMSPCTLLTGRTIDFNKHCKYEFGTYVQTHEETDNTMRYRTTGAITLWPTGNNQGWIFFLSLTTGLRLNFFHATILHMTTDVIKLVNTMASRNPPGLLLP